MKVFLGGTVNGSIWRDRFKEELIINYFDPVVDVWNDAAYERELSERRNCEYLLYVLTPKMTGYYAIAEVVDDSFNRPDRTLFCYLAQDEEAAFTTAQIDSFENLGQLVAENGGKWLQNLDEIISFLNSAKTSQDKNQKEYFDAFISFGRRESFHFATKIANKLSDEGYSLFQDVNEIPMIIEHQEYIYGNILRSDNFIYIISPNSVRSEYCKKELDFAIKFKKRIIPIIHVPLQQDHFLDDIIAQKKAISFEEVKRNMGELVHQIREIMEEDRSYVHQHSRLLYQARGWDFSGRPQGALLFGEERKKAKKWLQTPNKSILPLKTQRDFIEASQDVSLLLIPLLWLNKKTEKFTSLKWFDKVTLLISLGNPIALFLTLIDLLLANDGAKYEGISIPMWIGFLIIQMALTFVGIKTKDPGLFFSMVLSGFVSSTVIILTLIH